MTGDSSPSDAASTPAEPARGGLEEFRVAQLLPPMPLDVAAAVYRGVGEALEGIGYDAFVKEIDGIGVLWARRRPEHFFCTTVGHEEVPATTVGTYDDGDTAEPGTAYCAECTASLEDSGEYKVTRQLD